MNARPVPWIQKIPSGFDEMIEVAQNLKLFQIGEIGPTHFLFKDEEGDKYRIQISQTITCTCADRKINSHCIHSLFVMLKKFRVNPENPIVWQAGYIGQEIDDLVNFKFAVQNKRNNSRQSYLQARSGLKKIQKDMNNAKQSNRQPIDSESICPICQEDMHEDEALTFCRKKCGNNFHIKCLRVWIDHKLGSGDRITCPMCRTDITNGIFDDIRKDEDAYNVRYVTHVGKRCVACSKKNILGNLYHCLVCENVDLCHFCYHDNQHQQHSKFLMKKRKDSPWEIPQPSRQSRSHTVPNLPLLSLDTHLQRLSIQRQQQSTNGQQTDLVDFLISCFSLFKDLQQEQQITNHPSGLSIIGQEMNKHRNTCTVCSTQDSQLTMRKLNCGHGIHTDCLRQAFNQAQSPQCINCNVPLLPGYNSAKQPEYKNSEQILDKKKSLKIIRKKSLQPDTASQIEILGEKKGLPLEEIQGISIRKTSNFRIKKGIALPITSSNTQYSTQQARQNHLTQQQLNQAQAREHKENLQSLLITNELSLVGREVLSQNRAEHLNHNIPLSHPTLPPRNKIPLPKDKKSWALLSKTRHKIADSRNNFQNQFSGAISGQQILKSQNLSTQRILHEDSNSRSKSQMQIQQDDEQEKEENKSQTQYDHNGYQIQPEILYREQNQCYDDEDQYNFTQANKQDQLSQQLEYDQYEEQSEFAKEFFNPYQ